MIIPHAELPLLVLLAHIAITVGISLRVIMTRRPVGASLAWLTLLILLPFAGVVLYLFIGENRIGRRRARRATQIRASYRRYYDQLQHTYARDMPSMPMLIPMQREAQAMLNIPALPGNTLDLFDSSPAFMDQLIRDIDQARSHCHLLFYIWWPGGQGDQVVEAIRRAQARGVACRMLLDDIGSRRFLGSAQARQLRQAGDEVRSALPASLMRVAVARLDLRNHRKIVVIDDQIGYVGSQNLVDPTCFGLNRGVGQWVDAMVRLEGPAVYALNLTFLQDWHLECSSELDILPPPQVVRPDNFRQAATVQVVPSGPGQTPELIHEMLLSTLYNAERELIMTTPYFVPDDSMLSAMVACARRGVQVTLVVPERIDSTLVKLASASFYDDLMRVGVRVARYQKGLLHAKTITVDRHFSMIGSVNMDMRSFWINFEIALFVYDANFTRQMCDLQQQYLNDCVYLNRDQWASRSSRRRLVENSVRLLSPLL